MPPITESDHENVELAADEEGAVGGGDEVVPSDGQVDVSLGPGQKQNQQLHQAGEGLHVDDRVVNEVGVQELPLPLVEQGRGAGSIPTDDNPSEYPDKTEGAQEAEHREHYIGEGEEGVRGEPDHVRHTNSEAALSSRVQFEGGRGEALHSNDQVPVPVPVPVASFRH